MASHLQKHYPWISRPLIANAPMGGFAGAALATAVSLAGGVGFIGAVDDMGSLEEQLKLTISMLANTELESTSEKPLPIGVGFLLFAVKLEEAVAVIARYRPAVIWFACPSKTEDFIVWTEAMRQASPGSRIWIQVASVSKAIDLAEKCAPDVLAMQGSDAGGHGPCPGAGIISLVPETRDALNAQGFHNIQLLAAGGISDGRGVAAALASGAEGVVVGTGFLASKEIKLPLEYQDVILAAKDGGSSTVRATVFDELKGKSIWPDGYDGRAVVKASYIDFLNGVGIDELRRRYAEAAKEPHRGFGGECRGPVWAGSGVGLVNEVREAGDIVEKLRTEAKRALDLAIERF